MLLNKTSIYKWNNLVSLDVICHLYEISLVYETSFTEIYYINRTSVFMNFSAGQESNLLNPSYFMTTQQEQDNLEQSPGAAVTFEETLVVLNDLMFTQKDRYLSKAEITVLRGAWDNLEFTEIAINSRHSLNYLQRRLAPKLWDMLSDLIANGERVNKRNVRSFLEKVVPKKYNPRLAVTKEQTPLVDDLLVQVIKDKLPDISSFYGRTQELIHLKGLVTKQRCISLIGVPGTGKSVLAAKLLTEFSVESQPQFHCLIWKSITYAPLVEDLVADLIELIHPLEPGYYLPESTQAKITVLIKQLQSRRCLLVLDEFDALFQSSDLEQRLEYKILFRRLVEEQHQSCLLLTSRFLPDEFHSLITPKRTIQCIKLEGLDVEAAMRLLSDQGLADKEKCTEIIKNYRGNPSELKTIGERINHFFAGSTKVFFENQTTFISVEFQEMLDNLFGQVLNEVQRQIMLYLAERIASNSQPVNFVKLLTDINQQQRATASISEVVNALEKLERQSLIESSKDPVTKEINFTLQPVINKYIKKYITGERQKFISTSDPSSNLAIAS
jgi:DNA-binding MarR family transcriptional regulator